ncbi:hypothetical protein AM500_09750 [Bacillus sp. FJAT-18017]|uniref:DUF2332 domain-containing protein n=1 Tax=Bacillus sp. FJAT-18017 TaxID=1705566 RepID=UPI0006AE2BF2|nr:DUF2332 domain-containing protein [Bacillus sp. FJAT-18017]ALC90031.1 hypothetical protein AM500_09750 [Bacillus sp. FJAT-18017]
MISTKLPETFKAFAERECKGSSKLYESISLKLAEDPYVLELCSHAPLGQPVPNLLYGAVHYLLLKEKDHPLARFYASIDSKPQSPEAAFPHFKNFCAAHREKIIELLQIKMVQTNEVRRCGYLFPTFNYIYTKTNKPLALIEIGTSAGFQLLWDHYSYSYNKGTIYGSRESELVIQTEVIGKGKPLFPYSLPPVQARYGIDLHINDMRNEEDSLWMKALIWPEHQTRRELFEKAEQCMQQNQGKITFIEGNGVDLLPAIAGGIPDEITIVVFHTHVANQMPYETKIKLLETIKTIAAKRDIFHLYNNIRDSYLRLDSFVGDINDHKLVAETDGHGRWFSWKLT